MYNSSQVGNGSGCYNRQNLLTLNNLFAAISINPNHDSLTEVVKVHILIPDGRYMAYPMYIFYMFSRDIAN